MSKKFLAKLAIICLLCTMLPLSIFAAEGGQSAGTTAGGADDVVYQIKADVDYYNVIAGQGTYIGYRVEYDTNKYATNDFSYSATSDNNMVTVLTSSPGQLTIMVNADAEFGQAKVTLTATSKIKPNLVLTKDFTVNITPTRFSVYFNTVNGESVTLRFDKGAAPVWSGDAPTRPGYIFKGWAATADSNEVVDLSTLTVNNAMSFYAVWEMEETTVPVESVTLNKTELTLNSGEKETLTATVAPENATNKAVIWKSANTDIAEIDANGRVVAKHSGQTLVGAFADGVSGACELTVKEVLSSVRSSSEKITAKVEGTNIILSGVIAEDEVVDVLVYGTDRPYGNNNPCADYLVLKVVDGAVVAIDDETEESKTTLTVGKGNGTGETAYTVNLDAVKIEKAKVVAAQPAVEPQIPDDADEAEAEAIEHVSNYVSDLVTGNPEAVTTNGVVGAVAGNKTVDEAGNITIAGTTVEKAAIETAAAELPGDTYKTVVVPVPTFAVTGATVNEETGKITALKFDIKLMAQVKVTTAADEEPMNEVNTKNVGEPVEVPTNEKITVMLPVPNRVDFGDNVVYVKHTKDDGTVYNYRGCVTGGNIIFTSQHGFSEFEITADGDFAAAIGSELFTTLQDAVNAAADGAAITLGKNGEHSATVNKAVSFSVFSDSLFLKVAITAGDGYRLNAAESSYDPETGLGEYTIEKVPSGGGGGGSSSGGGGGSAKDEETKKDDTKTDTTKPAQDITPGKATMGNINTVFDDVKSGNWFANAVVYVYNKGMMQGVADGRFGPNDKTTRAMIVTMLYRLEGEPAAGAAGFSDVASGQWYSNAVAWASANAVVKGYETGAFGPNDAITREQLAAILYRFAQFKEYGVDTKGDLSGFADSAKVADWAKEAVQWAVGSGIINGNENNELAPGDNATRAEVAAMLMRFCQQFEK